MIMLARRGYGANDGDRALVDKCQKQVETGCNIQSEYKRNSTIVEGTGLLLLLTDSLGSLCSVCTLHFNGGDHTSRAVNAQAKSKPNMN